MSIPICDLIRKYCAGDPGSAQSLADLENQLQSMHEGSKTVAPLRQQWVLAVGIEEPPKEVRTRPEYFSTRDQQVVLNLEQLFREHLQSYSFLKHSRKIEQFTNAQLPKLEKEFEQEKSRVRVHHELEISIIQEHAA